jgi:hypothetical protein
MRPWLFLVLVACDHGPPPATNEQLDRIEGLVAEMCQCKHARCAYAVSERVLDDGRHKGDPPIATTDSDKARERKLLEELVTCMQRVLTPS